jgi:two-component system chemotaxis sensor kinase CheA
MIAMSAVANTQEKDDSLIRIKAGRVAMLLDMIGEISLAADAVTHHPDIIDLNLDEYQSAAHKLSKLIRELQDVASGLRLVPIDGIFKRMQRLARDLAKSTNKDFEFTLLGEDTEIDKVVVETLTDPLVHLIRNAIDHGLESKEERIAANKPANGQVMLKAHQDSGEIIITLKDDGKGLNKAAIVQRAIDKGLIRSDHALTDDEIWNLIFLPGFSTKEAVSALSGRGVGMDVVKTTIEYLRGRIEIETKAQQGTEIRLIIPLSLAFLDTMVVDINQKKYAVPVEHIIEVLRMNQQDLVHSSADASKAVKVRGKLIPLYALEELYQEKIFEYKPEQTVIILKSNASLLALPIDQILGQYQVSIKPLNGFLKDIRAASGCALLPSGDICIVMDCHDLMNKIRIAQQSSRSADAQYAS